jgi:hypothetical protein
VPTFDEALALAKGKIGIYVDTKSAAPKDLVAAIELHEMGEDVMFWSEHVNFLKQIADLRPAWMLMPEAFNPAHIPVCWASTSGMTFAAISKIGRSMHGKTATAAGTLRNPVSACGTRYQR